MAKVSAFQMAEIEIHPRRGGETTCSLQVFFFRGQLDVSQHTPMGKSYISPIYSGYVWIINDYNPQVGVFFKPLIDPRNLTYIPVT